MTKNEKSVLATSALIGVLSAAVLLFQNCSPSGFSSGSGGVEVSQQTYNADNGNGYGGVILPGTRLFTSGGLCPDGGHEDEILVNELLEFRLYRENCSKLATAIEIPQGEISNRGYFFIYRSRVWNLDKSDRMIKLVCEKPLGGEDTGADLFSVRVFVQTDTGDLKAQILERKSATATDPDEDIESVELDFDVFLYSEEIPLTGKGPELIKGLVARQDEHFHLTPDRVIDQAESIELDSSVTMHDPTNGTKAVVFRQLTGLSCYRP